MLNGRGMFEEAAQHFEFVSASIRGGVSMASEHNVLGEGF